MPKTEHDLTDAIRSTYLTDKHRRQNTDRLIRSLLSGDEEDKLTCRECEELLPDYLLAQREGTADQVRWRLLALHLSMCPHCADELVALLQLVSQGLGEQGVEPAAYPEPDLSFLPGRKRESRRPAATHWHLDELGRLIIDLAVALFPPPDALAPAYALRGDSEVRTPEAGGGQQPIGRLSLGAPEFNDLQVEVSVLPEKGSPALCIVVARVEVPSRYPDMKGSQVTLRAGDTESTMVTDESGEATFRGIAVAGLADAVLTVSAAQ